MEILKEHQPNYFDREIRERHDAETWLAEVLDGRMLTEFSYTYDNEANELYAEDGSSLGKIFEDAITDAERLAWQNPSLSFEVRRRKKEIEEYKEMLGMMQAGPNTMVVVSDFPPELMSASEDVGGYNVTRKQTMLRVITRTEDGSIKVRSQSLDGSNRKGLESIYESLGQKAGPGELLGQRITKDLDGYSQEFLVDRLTGVYDRSLSSQYGGNWRAGRSPQINQLNTHDFVIGQTDLIDYFIRNKNKVGASEEDLAFAVAAEMERRWNNQVNSETPSVVSPVNIDPAMLEYHVQQSYVQAKSEGKSYSGCGSTVKSTDKQLKELGYGNQSNESEKEDEEGESDQFGPLVFKCKKGHTNKRPRGKLIDCKIKGCDGASC